MHTLLALDTSTAVASVALFDGGAEAGRGAVVAEHTWHSGQRHTVQLLPNVRDLMSEAGLRPADLAAVGVALGPGSFNGLRVGLATAKALSLSLGIPLVGVNTLEATAYQHREAISLRPSGGLIRPLYDAGRGQVATALYAAAASDLREVEPPRLAELQEIAGSETEPTLFCGELRPSWAEEIIRRGGPLANVSSAAANFRRAGYLAEAAWRRLMAGRIADPATLQPLYLRRPPVLDRQTAPEQA